MSNPYQNANQYQNNSYELNDYSNKQYSSSNEDDFVQFMNEIQDINSQLDNYSNIINLIDNKQRNFLHGLDLNDEDTEYDSKQIENLVNEAQSLQLDLKIELRMFKPKLFIQRIKPKWIKLKLVEKIFGFDSRL